MSEFNIDDLDEVIASADSSLVQMLALQLKKQIDISKASEQQLDAVVAENAGLKDAVIERENLHEEIRKAGMPPHTDFWHQSIFMADKKVDDALNCTPATDAAIAKIQAQGVDAAIEQLIKKFEGTGHIGVPVMVLEHFAASLRQGAAL